MDEKKPEVDSILNELKELKEKEKILLDRLTHIVHEKKEVTVIQCEATDEDLVVVTDDEKEPEKPERLSLVPLSNLREPENLENNTLRSSGYYFDIYTSCYFNREASCYYIPEYKLFYYPEKCSYYNKDDSGQGIRFHSLYSDRKLNNILNQIHKEFAKLDKEEGELSDEENNAIIEAPPKLYKDGAPFLRLIVKSTDLNLPKGTSFFVTRDGGTLGREGKREILIPDINISKCHCEFRYVCKDGRDFYEVVDLGSRNGTYVNNQKLIGPLFANSCAEISHKTVLRVNRTELVCHIHPGWDTCDECKPMQTPEVPQKTNVSLKVLYANENKRLKRKFGLNVRPGIKSLMPAANTQRTARRKRNKKVQFNNTNKTKALMSVFNCGWFGGNNF